jgi:hypothetical protein
MKKVYVLSRGDYQDYRLVGIYATKKKAQKDLEIIAKKEICRIDVFTLNKRY